MSMVGCLNFKAYLSMVVQFTVSKSGPKVDRKGSFLERWR